MRIALLSVRDQRQVPWFGGLADAENALAAAFGGPVHRLRPAAAVPTVGPLASGHARRVLGWTRALCPYRIERDPRDGSAPADVLLVVLNDLHDAALLMETPGWSSLAEQVVVHIAEINERDVRIYPDVLAHLRQSVDHLFTGVPGECLARVPGRRLRSVEVVPNLLDVLAFSGARGPESRPIDVLNLGRRHPRQHAALMAWAEREDAFYLHDTGYLGSVSSLSEHRRQYRGLASRARVFVTNLAAVGNRRRGFPSPQIGTRFYEAMAAGCVLTGELPTAAPHWADVAPAEPVPFPLESDAVPGELLAVMADPVEFGRRSRAARAAALGACDVAHRWREMSAIAGLPAVSGVEERIARLESEAARTVVGTGGSASR